MCSEINIVVDSISDIQNAEDYEILACSNSLILRECFTAVNNVKNTMSTK